ncbi:MAG: orotate phosphoribosyltransferase [Candidatus Thermoplasmatota archaeon]|nr:orotate phosphoribosyltransferase [Candidatus Thermoplasmatota archaeon]MCL5731609.1 orotate phosphoribosyltransferase [Candidatus Thermoplasmatota archaeon]
MSHYKGLKDPSELDGLRKMLVDHKAVLFGNFKLTSGKESDVYVDIKKAYTDPVVLQRIATGIIHVLKTDMIAGVELGAIPIIAAVSVIGSVPFIMIRKEREHGTKELVIGPEPAGMKVTIIEDVVTTGGSVLKAAESLRSKGALVSEVICVVDREEGGSENLRSAGISLRSLVKLSELMKS